MKTYLIIAAVIAFVMYQAYRKKQNKAVETQPNPDPVMEAEGIEEDVTTPTFIPIKTTG
jgi:large-conductance mechanosensitive channel